MRFEGFFFPQPFKKKKKLLTPTKEIIIGKIVESKLVELLFIFIFRITFSGLENLKNT